MTVNFTVLKSSADAKRYYHPHGHDYWVEDGHSHAFFGGKLAERLGLGAFDLEQFHRLCDGLHPLTGQKLTPGRREGSRAGWDVTVDGPKDLGVLIGLGLDARIIPDVLEQAGRDVMALIERDAKTRVRVAKQDTDRATGEIAYTGILHLTSRPVGSKIDVQPHYHFLVANATWDDVEHKMKALQLQAFAANGAKLDRPFYTAYLNSRLDHYMRQLGYQTTPDGQGSFHVVGVPEHVRDEFSQRTKKINAVAKKLEQQKQAFLGDPTAKLNPEVKGRLGAHTREAKQPGQTWDSLVDHWCSRVTPADLWTVRNTVAKATKPLAMPYRDHEAVQFAFDHLLERASVVPERQVVTEALKWGVGRGVTRLHQ
jgi:conjugative relaxase-like TrwC/TraI family protein